MLVVKRSVDGVVHTMQAPIHLLIIGEANAVIVARR
jgi:hypothetical protein